MIGIFQDSFNQTLIDFFIRYHRSTMPFQELLKTFCENAEFIATRRKVLRLRAGLRDTDRRLVLAPGSECCLY